MNIMKSFRETLLNSKHVLILSGSGISAESGIPTFRGAGGFWRKYQVQNLATPEAFAANPSLVWEFYEYRRTVAAQAQPNTAHQAIAEFQKRLRENNRIVSIITQNIDGLHQKAGADNVVELHGSLFKTQCTKCKVIEKNECIPICPALEGKGSPDPNTLSSDVAVKDLPRCNKNNCGGLLRPYIIWFGENLDQQVLSNAHEAVDSCDACLVVGTSSVVYPAAMFAPLVAQRGVSVAEFNIETTPATRDFQYHFDGPCSVTIPEALAP
ncbi:NAD-dependent protein deacylase sirtuin-5, mitochondrial-like [Leptopilina heterotoma]|uniref:NAD-dependent protein deacylase sirtuin-5, mitochondrial-like n=1 Tax=Leptopilina heterotoma TaxID=63436 RepID=UPI001CA95E3D|nr:NAD-dependent protein deacylase sirtuin-5, mitochondrial-like [Leptopilina heterotoma]XP_043465000.1 NAD-dependent protein deacylase sirtuin-5, mitochondrial-like [Leptopilina heterotoma]XP_043465001.1 NAD-dependent protein deacylase sirtuin-5, mitochondrial-like [Leptopilina heterotoma]XP_043465002.1 NAD-dependent protein deacylase sirtuin-5, mitochondrial-like [Leptopilina heterotoma]XP_043465003.1 NAD-dependent protein deacylase sirtuin-5, mitochondrial-like [Leptopilina heterotoma]